MSDKLLRINQIVRADRNSSNTGLLPICKSTWWAGVQSGAFPQPIKIGAKCTCWKKSDIDQIIDGTYVPSNMKGGHHGKAH